MRALTGCLVLTFLCVAGLATACAQEGRQGPGGKTAPPRAPRFDASRFIKDYDKNSDGKLSKDEAPAHLKEHFDQIDANKDGHLSQEELQHYAERMAHRRPQAVEMLYIVVDTPADEVVTVQDLQRAYDLLRKFDTNKDGKINAAAVSAFRKHRCEERLNHIIKDLDKNGDGKISKEEARGLLSEEFDRLDTNKDGFLDRQELEKAFTPMPEAGRAAKTPPR